MIKNLYIYKIFSYNNMPKNKIKNTINQQPTIVKNLNQHNEHGKHGQHGGNGIFKYIHDHVLYLNSNKFFAGVIMILLNVGSKFIPIQFSKSAEEYLKYSITKQILIFAMAWMGTRDIYASLVLTAVFVILSEHLFNEESYYCIVPHKHRILHKIKNKENDNINTNNSNTTNNNKTLDEQVNETENALSKLKEEKRKKEQQSALMKFDYQQIN